LQVVRQGELVVVADKVQAVEQVVIENHQVLLLVVIQQVH
jgi:hypothetical protein